MLHELIFASNAAPILGAKRREIHSLQLTQYSYQCAQLENPLYFVILMKIFKEISELMTPKPYTT